MTRAPRTLAVLDAGAATTSVSLLVRADGRWRLAGTLAGPAGTPEAALLGTLIARVRAADPELGAWPELRAGVLDAIPTLAARSRPPGLLLVLGASRRIVVDLESEAIRTGWRIRSASTESHDPREMTACALDPDVDAVLIGAGDPPGPDERRALEDLAALGGAVARRRPDLRMLIGPAIRARRAWTHAMADDPGDPDRIVEAPPPSGRRGTSHALRAVLDGLRWDPIDGRSNLRAVTASLAELLDLRVELLEVGFDGGARLLAEPGAAGSGPSCRGIVSAEGGLVPPEPDDDTVDSVLAWTTGSLDRHRMSDRLRDLRRHPWVDAAGDGARLRLAAVSAALTRLAALTPDLTGRPPADLTVIAGGAFATAPASAMVLGVADTIRRPGSTQLAWDHARLLGPIGTIEDADERRSLLADLVRDALVPLGSLVIASGIGGLRASGRRAGARSGRVSLEAGGSVTKRDLTPGELAFLDLPPGSHGEAHFEFSEPVRLGKRARRVRVPVAGGLAGVVLDLRDVPLNLPDRRDRRRSRLADWGAQAWPHDDR
ncbi:MAG: hypothetical protein HYX54_02555 [Chloroflexi bacterium]|nr:hypothetical protein [Chloroflexota bacterium]